MRRSKDSLLAKHEQHLVEARMNGKEKLIKVRGHGSNRKIEKIEEKPHSRLLMVKSLCERRSNRPRAFEGLPQEHHAVMRS